MSNATVTVDEIVAAFRDEPNNAYRGTMFEKLMVQYFENDPTLSKQYDKVMRWPDWEHREGTVDTGIDLVARDRITGSWTAIQCKFFAPGTYLQKSQIDSFFTASGKTWDGVGFTNRIIISTTDKWSKHAQEALEGQSIPVQRIGLSEISAAPIDWAFAQPGRLEVDLQLAKKYSPRPHQELAIGRTTSACPISKSPGRPRRTNPAGVRNGCANTRPSRSW